MATLIRNKLTIIPNAHTKEEYEKQIKEVTDFCMGIDGKDKKNMCFDKIAPKPTSIKIDSIEEDDWLLRNWGTRVKALNSCWISDDEMIFDTYWNPAIPIFIKIIKQFPNIRFNFKYSSKRVGFKAGELNAANGKIIFFKKYNNFSKEAFEVSFCLMPHTVMLYVYNQKIGTYEYDITDFRQRIEQDGFFKAQDGTVLIGVDDKKKPLFNSINDLPF